jgi:hypothetical protein
LICLNVIEIKYFKYPTISSLQADIGTKTASRYYACYRGTLEESDAQMHLRIAGKVRVGANQFSMDFHLKIPDNRASAATKVMTPSSFR